MVAPFPKRIRLPHEAYANRESIFHLVIRAAPDTIPFRGSAGAAVWAVVVSEFERKDVDLLVACLMPDHFHAIVKPGDHSVIHWVNGFKSFTTHAARPFTKRPILWQPSFWDRGLRNEEEYEEAVFYVANNPVDARLAATADEWPWTKQRPGLT